MTSEELLQQFFRIGLIFPSPLEVVQPRTIKIPDVDDYEGLITVDNSDEESYHVHVSDNGSVLIYSVNSDRAFSITLPDLISLAKLRGISRDSQPIANFIIPSRLDFEKVQFPVKDSEDE